MAAIDTAGIVIEPAFNLDDFGLVVFPYALPTVWLFAIALWMRGFLLKRASIGMALCGILTLPGWYLWNAIATFLFYLPGRVNPNF